MQLEVMQEVVKLLPTQALELCRKGTDVSLFEKDLPLEEHEPEQSTTILGLWLALTRPTHTWANNYRSEINIAEQSSSVEDIRPLEVVQLEEQDDLLQMTPIINKPLKTRRMRARVHFTGWGEPTRIRDRGG